MKKTQTKDVDVYICKKLKNPKMCTYMKKPKNP